MHEITVQAHRRDEPGRWVRLRLGLRDRSAGEPFLAHGTAYACAIEPGDDVARRYGPANWESGILSGAGYAWRRWLSDNRGLLVSELTGRLKGGDIDGIAAATLGAAAALLGRDYPTDAHSEWSVTTVPTAVNGAESNESREPAAKP